MGIGSKTDRFEARIPTRSRRKILANDHHAATPKTHRLRLTATRLDTQEQRSQVRHIAGSQRGKAPGLEKVPLGQLLEVRPLLFSGAFLGEPGEGGRGVSGGQKGCWMGN